LHDLPLFLRATDEAGNPDRQVMVRPIYSLHDSSYTWGRSSRCPQLRLVRRRQLQRHKESLDSVPLRAGAAAFDLLDSVLAQPGTLGERLLRQPGSEPVPPK